MSITQPSDNLELPADVIAAIERSRNLISINEAEAIRLRELALSSQYTVNELHKQKVELEEQVANLRQMAEKLNVESAAARDTLREKRSAIVEAEENIARINNEAAETKRLLDTARADMSQREADVLRKEAGVAAENALVAARCASAKEQEEKIKAFAASL